MAEIFGSGMSRTMRVLKAEGCSIDEIAAAVKRPRTQVRQALLLKPVKVYSRGHATKASVPPSYHRVIAALHPDWPAAGPWLGVHFGPGCCSTEPTGGASGDDDHFGGLRSPLRGV